MTYHLYHDGQRIVEERNGSDLVIRQYVPEGPQAVWGRDYVDELCQIGINHDPADANEGPGGNQCLCDSFYYGLHDPMYNVIGLVNSTGALVERYEYTPYGQRTVFISPGASDSLCMSPVLESRRVTVIGTAQPYGFCDVGHQGLFFDKEFGLVHNRARMLHPGLGRFMQRDPGTGGAVLERQFLPWNQVRDGLNLYQSCKSSPLVYPDPSGLRTKDWVWCGSRSIYIETDYCCADDLKKIQRVACSAFNTLNAVNDALYNHEYVRPWTGAHDYTRTQFNRFFYGRQTGAIPNKDVERIRSVYVDLIDELDDSDGTYYKCEGGQGECAGAEAWARSWVGWTVHICHNFLHSSTDRGRSKTLIHELSHLYQQTSDHGDIYVTGLEPEGLPVYERYDEKKRDPWTPASLPQGKRFAHADTLSEFAGMWYVP